MKLPKFDYASPATLEEAVALLAAGNGAAPSSSGQRYWDRPRSGAVTTMAANAKYAVIVTVSRARKIRDVEHDLRTAGLEVDQVAGRLIPYVEGGGVVEGG